MSNPRPHDRVFDLDDVRALLTLFEPYSFVDLRVLTFTDEERNDWGTGWEVECVEMAEVHRRYSAFCAAREDRVRKGPMFSMLEIYWLHANGVWSSDVLRPHQQAIEAWKRGGRGEQITFEDASGERSTFEDCHGFEIIRKQVRLESVRPRKISDARVDRHLIDVFARFIDAETRDLHEASDQAMAEQDDPPVPRPRSRL